MRAAALDAVGRDGGGRDRRAPSRGRGFQYSAHAWALLWRTIVPAVLRLRVGALVAGDQARRDAHRAQHDDERGGEVLAEADPAIEPELVHRIAFVGAGRQRVGEAGGADVAVQALDDGVGVDRLRRRAWRGCSRSHCCDHARVRGKNCGGRRRFSRRSAGDAPTMRSSRPAVARRRTRCAIGRRVRHCRSRSASGPHVARRRAPARPARHRSPPLGRLRRRELQHRQPGELRRLQRHLVRRAAGRAARRSTRGSATARRERPSNSDCARHSWPSVSISTGPRKYSCAARRRAAVELDAERDAVVVGEVGDAAQLEVVGQARAVGGVGRRPQRPDAREQQEQRDHHRRADQRRAARQRRRPGGSSAGPPGCGPASAP